MALFTIFEIKVVSMLIFISVVVYVSYFKYTNSNYKERLFISFDDYMSSYNHQVYYFYEDSNANEYMLARVNQTTSSTETLNKMNILFSTGVNQEVKLSSTCIKNGISHIYFHIDHLSCIDIQGIRLFNLYLNDIRTLNITIYSLNNIDQSNYVNLFKINTINFIESKSSMLCINNKDNIKSNYALRFEMIYKHQNETKLDNRRLCFNQLIGYYE
jgi:hypothetical protein